MKGKLNYLFLGAGIITVVATRLHQLIYYPHMTEAQAFLYYWPMWTSAVLWIIIGYYINRKKEER